jgi:hypothetical protein
MNINMITDKHNHDNGYISLINISLQNVPERVNVDGYELLRRSEFHVSIMALKNLAPMLNPDNVEQASEQLKQDFLEFIKDHKLADFHLTGEYRLVKRDERVTVVTMVKLEDTDKLFDYLRSKHHVDFPTQPTHITLHTLQPEAGIGILSHDELVGSSSVIDVPALADVRITNVEN